MPISYGSAAPSGQKKSTSITTTDGRSLTATGPRSVRNFNPGNIEAGSYANSLGAVGTDGRFAAFPDRATGLKAVQSLVFEGKNYKDLTLEKAIERYAPPTENNSKQYAKRVADAIGVSVKTKMSDIPSSLRPQVAEAMANVEGKGVATLKDEKGRIVADLDPSRAVPVGAVERASLAPLGGGLMAASSIPTPTANPRGLIGAQNAIGGLLSASAKPSVSAMSYGPQQPSLSAASAVNVADRISAAERPMAYAQASPTAGAGTMGATASTSVSPQREANLQGRINAAFSQPSSGGLLGVNQAAAATFSAAPARASPTISASKPSTGFAGPVGSPRSMEATYAGPTAGARYASAPATRAVAAPAPAAARTVPTPTARAVATPTAGAAATGVARVSVPAAPQMRSPRAIEDASMAALSKPLTDFEAAKRINAPPASFQTPAFTTAKPMVDALGQPPIPGLQRITPVAPLPAPVAVAPPPKVAVAPRAVAPVSQVATAPRAPTVSTSTGLGLPGIPNAPDQPGFFDAGGLLDRNKGKIVGGLLGTAVAGPLGGILGGFIGQKIQNGGDGTPSRAAQAAGAAGWDGFSGMTVAQSQAAMGAGQGGLLSGLSIGGLFSGLSGGGQISSAARSAAATSGFDGFGYSGSSSRSSGGSTTSSTSRSTSTANKGSGGGGGIGPGGSGARDPSGSSRK